MLLAPLPLLKVILSLGRKIKTGPQQQHSKTMTEGAQGIHHLSLWEAYQVSEMYGDYWNTHIKWGEGHSAVLRHGIGFFLKHGVLQRAPEVWEHTFKLKKSLLLNQTAC